MLTTSPARTSPAETSPVAKSLRVSVSGTSELKSAASTMTDRVKTEMQSELASEARQLEQDAKSFVRVDSGDLRDSIEARVGDMTADVAPRSGNLSGDYEKAMVNEFGSSNDPGQAYMLPASEASRQRWPDRAAAAVRRGASG